MAENSSIIPKLEQNVASIERVISAAAGSYLLYSALTGKKSAVKALAGGFLLFRGATGYCPAYNVVQKSRTNPWGNILVQSSATVNQPKDEVYKFWRKLDNLPLFMKHLESVTVLDKKHAVWKAKIPGKLGTIEWKSEIVSDEPGRYISWKSLSGSDIHNSGIVKFKDAGNSTTEVHVELSYHAPAGVIGEGLGHLLNPVLEKIIHKDIENFREYIETGKVPA